MRYIFLSHLSELYVLLSYVRLLYLRCSKLIRSFLYAKKSTLYVNATGSYRPITVSSSYAKMLELLIGFNDEVDNTHFGFRNGLSSLVAYIVWNDICCVYKDQKSPISISTLDAVRYIDKLWHPGLFYKLYVHMDHVYWGFMVKWLNG